MSHEKTVIEPSTGLTVIAGENNCGKSAIVSAIQTVCSNATGNYMVRHGEKECRIILETDDDQVVEWRRVNRTVSYVVNGEEIDRTRGKVPDKVQAALRMGKVEAENEEFDIHFADQKSPIFLLNGTPGQRAAFFASSSDAGKLIEMQTLHKSKTVEAQRQLKEIQKQESLLKGRLQTLCTVPNLEKGLDELAVIEKQLNESNGQIHQLEQVIRDVRSFSAEQQQLQIQVTNLRKIPTFPVFDEAEKLQSVINAMNHWNSEVTKSSRMVSCLDSLDAPPPIVETDSIEQQIDLLGQSKRRVKQLNASTNALKLPSFPSLVDETRLAGLYQKLFMTHKEHQAWQSQIVFLENLVPVELDDNESSVAQRIYELNLSKEELTDRETEVQSLKNKVDIAKHDFDQALIDNGNCPTCGQETAPTLPTPSPVSSAKEN